MKVVSLKQKLVDRVWPYCWCVVYVDCARRGRHCTPHPRWWVRGIRPHGANSICFEVAENFRMRDYFQAASILKVASKAQMKEFARCSLDSLVARRTPGTGCRVVNLNIIFSSRTSRPRLDLLNDVAFPVVFAHMSRLANYKTTPPFLFRPPLKIIKCPPLL